MNPNDAINPIFRIPPNMSDTIENEPESSLALAVRAAVPTIIAADKDDILGAYARKVSAFRPDISTERGRAAIRSIAAEGRSVKATLLRLGDAAKEDALKIQRAIVAEKKVLEDRMDAVIAKVRAPLTAYEEAEKARVDAHEAALTEMSTIASLAHDATSEQVRAALAALGALPARNWELFAERAAQLEKNCRANLAVALASAIKREEEAAELARLREESAARQRAEAARHRSRTPGPDHGCCG